MPAQPFYRVIPQLADYPDEFCRLLIRRLVVRGPRYAVLAAVNGAVAVLIAAAVALVGVPIVLAFVSPGGSRVGADWAWPASMVTGVAAFWVSYRTLARGTILSMLRDAIRPRFIDGARCIACGYALDGLRGADFRIVCPECGRRVPIGRAAAPLVDQMIAWGELPDPSLPEYSPGWRGAGG